MPSASPAVDARELVVDRTFHAPADLVFEAWSRADHLDRWWGPRGFTTSTKSMDFRPGGTWIYTMRGPDGKVWPNRIAYREIERPRRLTYHHDDDGTNDDPGFDVVVEFTPDGERTQARMRMRFATPELREKVVREYGAEQGAHQTLDRLEEQLARAVAQEFTIERTFDAPRALVWKAWTERDHLVRWFGPKGSTMVHCENDLRPGGRMLYALRGPDGKEMWGRWIYREIAAPERIVLVSSFSDAQGGITRAPFFDDWPLETLSSTTFREKDGRTTVTLRWVPLRAEAAERARFAAMHASMNGGWTGTFDQLAEYLASAAARP